MGMLSKLKSVSILLGALAALATFSVVSASASEFTSEAVHTDLKGTQHTEDVFSFNAGNVTCKEINYTGTMTAAKTTTIELTPVYISCKAFGFINTTIDHEGCNFKFSTEAGTENNEGNVSIVCPPGKVMKVTGFTCEVTIPAQTNLKKVTYTNQNSGGPKERDITVDLNLVGVLTYTQHSLSFPGCLKASFINGTYTGAITLKGFNLAGNQVGLLNH
jgi:hypothetical protein